MISLLLAAALRAGHVAPVSCGYSLSLRRAFSRGLSPSFAPSAPTRLLEGLDDTDVQNVHLEVQPNFSTHAIAGTATETIASRLDGLDEFHFRLGSNFAVSAASVDGTAVSVVFDDASHAHVALPHAYDAGQTFSLVISYSGLVQSGGFGSIDFGTHGGGNPYCFTLSEPWYSYTWWPNKDDNTDKALMSIDVTVPNTMQVAANGLLQGVDDAGGGKSKFRWASNYPMAPYLLCFGATNFTHFSDSFVHSGGTMPLEFYIWPESDSTSHRNAWKAVKQMLATYGDWYGPYPFIAEKYGIYQFSFGGGQEHQTMTGENSFGNSLSSHELAHQWWGDNVTCATWNDIWLNEGFATYSEAVWIEKQPGSTGLPALKQAMQDRIPGSVDGTVYVYDPNDINRIFDTNYTYLKGGWVQHMLRHVVGDANFWAGLALYRSRHQLGTATTEDYKHDMQDQTGLDLTQFFDQWVYEPGAPKYSYGYANLDVDGQKYVAVSLKQTQPNGDPTFAMPVDVKLTAGGVSTVVAKNSARSQWYLFPTSAPATAVALDPDGWILNRGISQGAYVPGPPKVVSSNPAPGATYTSGALTVTFSKPVNLARGDVYLISPYPQASPVVASYDAAHHRALILLNQSMRPGAYTLVVRDTITAQDSGLKLDGEGPNYPSGDGLPGGELRIDFTVPG